MAWRSRCGERLRRSCIVRYGRACTLGRPFQRRRLCLWHGAECFSRSSTRTVAQTRAGALGCRRRGPQRRVARRARSRCHLDRLLPAGQVKAQRLATERGVSITTERVDLTTWTAPPDFFDVVVAIFAQPVPAATLFECIRKTVRPGGLVLIEGYTPKQLEYKTGGPGDIARLYTRAMYEDGFAGFTLVDIAEYDAEIYEGDGHGGMSALIDLIAIK
jgi:hypothetical protein